MTSYSVASVLPIEILAHIFDHLPPRDQDPHIANAPLPSWLAVTHVSRQWRSASLSFSRFWSNVVTSNPRWTEECLRRSNEAPISIDIRWNKFSEPFPQHFILALSQAHRASFLLLALPQLDRYVVHLPEQSYPNLTTLSLEDSASSTPLVNPFSFPQDARPKLTTLCLRACCIPWTSPFFGASLTSLELTDIPLDHRPPLEQLCALLSSLSALSTITLCRALPENIQLQDILDHASECILPHATFLSITDVYITSIAIILGVLQVPLPCDVSTHFIYRSGMTYPHNFMAIPLACFLSVQLPGSGPDPRTYRDFRVEEDPITRELNVVLYPDMSSYQSPVATKKTPKIAISIATDHRDTQIDFLRVVSIDVLICCMRIILVLRPDTTSFTVSVAFFRNPLLWWKAFQHIHHIRSLRVQGPAALGLILALDGQGRVEGEVEVTMLVASDVLTLFEIPLYKSADMGQRQRAHLFPFLAHLCIESADFELENPTVAGERTLLPLLKRVLSRRKAEDVQELETLEILGCDLQGERVDMLESVLGPGVVNWDGCTSRDRGDD